MNEVFRTTAHGNFQITFPNNISVSTNNGVGAYVSERQQNKEYAMSLHDFERVSPNIEIAIFDENDNGADITNRWRGNANEGWCSPDDYIEALIWARDYRR